MQYLLRLKIFFFILLLHCPKCLADGIILGDINNDGKISVEDITLLIHLLNEGQKDHVRMNAADINLDGKLNLSDVESLSNIIIRKINSNADTLFLYYFDKDVLIVNPFSSDSVSIIVPKGSCDVFVEAHSCPQLIISAEGESANGSLCVNSDNNYKLYLHGLSLSSQKGAAFQSISNQKLIVELADNSNNRFEDAFKYDQEETISVNGCFNSMGPITFNGHGILNVIGNLKHAIYCKKTINFETGSICVQRAKSDAIHSGKNLNISGGTLHLNGMGGDGIDIDNDFKMTDGTLTMYITGESAKGIKCGGYMSISNGKISATALGPLKNVNGDLSYCTILKCDSSAFILGGELQLLNTSPGGKCVSVGCDATITGGIIHLENNGDGAEYTNIYGNKDYYTSKCISVDNNLNIQGGSITCINNGNGGKGISVTNNFYGGKKNSSANECIDLFIQTNGWSIVDDIENDNREGCPKALKIGMFGYIYSGTYEFQTKGMGGEGIEARGLKIYDGDIICNTYDDGINLQQDMTMKGGRIFCNSINNDGIDSNGNITISGGNIFSISQHNKDEAFDTEGCSFHINGGTVIGLGHSSVDLGESIQPVHVDLYQYFPISYGKQYEVRDSKGNVLIRFESIYEDSECRSIISSPLFNVDELYYLYDNDNKLINILEPKIRK